MSLTSYADRSGLAAQLATRINEARFSELTDTLESVCPQYLSMAEDRFFNWNSSPLTVEAGGYKLEVELGPAQLVAGANGSSSGQVRPYDYSGPAPEDVETSGTLNLSNFRWKVVREETLPYRAVVEVSWVANLAVSNFWNFDTDGYRYIGQSGGYNILNDELRQMDIYPVDEAAFGANEPRTSNPDLGDAHWTAGEYIVEPRGFGMLPFWASVRDWPFGNPYDAKLAGEADTSGRYVSPMIPGGADSAELGITEFYINSVGFLGTHGELHLYAAPLWDTPTTPTKVSQTPLPTRLGNHVSPSSGSGQKVYDTISVGQVFGTNSEVILSYSQAVALCNALGGSNCNAPENEESPAPDPNAPDPSDASPTSAPMPDRNPPVPDGQPPTVTPMPRPITSSCKSTMDGPASCNFVVDPLPGSNFPKPGDVVAVPDFATPDFATPDFAPMPVIDVNFPEMPPIGCNLPDFTNMSDCPPVPGTGGPLPGGRDRRGKRGINPNIKTGGKTHGKRRKVFPGPKHSGPHKRCFPAGSSCMGAITELLIGVGISPLDIVFQIGPEWDKQLRREKCFKRGVSRLDAAAWFASKLMCRIIDEGPPTHNVYIGPPHHRPGQKTWTFDEHFDLFAVSHSSTSEGSYHAVEVFGDHFREPYPISLVENPFASPDESEILQIEVGPDYTRREAEQLAAFRAAALRRASVSVQASVPYSEEYMMRDRMILRAPDRGFQETYLIYGKQSDLSPEGRIHILTGVLPATAREMEQFPRVT